MASRCIDRIAESPETLPFCTAMCFLSVVLLHLCAPQRVEAIGCLACRKSVVIYFLSGIPTLLGVAKGSSCMQSSARLGHLSVRQSLTPSK